MSKEHVKNLRRAANVMAMMGKGDDATRLRAAGERITELEEAARRWYQPDGSFVLLTPEQVVEKRKAAAARIAELEGENAKMRDAIEYAAMCLNNRVACKLDPETGDGSTFGIRKELSAALTPPTKEAT